MRAATGIYDGEDDRKKSIGPPLREILGRGISKVSNSDRTMPDGMIEVLRSGQVAESAAFPVEEEKRDQDCGDAWIVYGSVLGAYNCVQNVGLRLMVFFLQVRDCAE
jgi:hypothetical protein